MEFIFQPFEPPAALKGLVRQSFFAKGRIPYRTDKILPTGLVALLFTLGNPHRAGKAEDPNENTEFEHSWLSGLQTTPQYHTPRDGTHVIGVLFEPVGLYALFGSDMVGLNDKTIDPREVLPREFIRLVESLFPRADEQAAHAELFDRLLQYERQAIPGWLLNFHQAIVATRGDVDIDVWYRKSGHSKRHAADQFRKAVGITPKVLCRIHRLTALLEAVDPATDVNWTELAHTYGFYDQAHFNHEFRKLSGLYPSEYLAQRRRDLPELKKGESVAFAPQR